MKILITFTAVAGIILHAIFPDIEIDAISVALFFIALLPWLSTLFEELELPGGWKVKFKKSEELAQRAQEAGLIADVTTEDQERYAFQSVATSDKNLALAGLRIEIEKNLKDIATANGIGTRMQGLGRIMQFLSDKELISWQEKSILSDLIGLLNNAVHGAKIDEKSFLWAMDYGVGILKSLELRKESMLKS
ncbi:hypothetical protein [Marispirochaeta aestuarii]|uniref:hypothetical protein n=1 Tax=Marispirochaeta aestuarii TaxID=1963862 RepID=UPI002ABDF597|nr:hypothetical protein [Marispirochaeta aestuarii]